MKAKGLVMADLFLNSHKSKPEHRDIEAVYCYDGFEVVRTRPKGFYQRRPDGKGGFINNLKGIEPTLCHQDGLPQAIDGGKAVYVVEGEKDVDRLRTEGFTATCNPMGEGKWRDSYSQALKGADLVIIPDNDQPGRDHAVQVARACRGKAARIRVLELPNNYKDISHWLDHGGDIRQLENLAASCQDYMPPPETAFADQPYCIEDNRLCWVKQTYEGHKTTPMCNFTAQVTEDILKDNGLETTRYLKVRGALCSGLNLPAVEVKSESFNSLNWVRDAWGIKTIIAAGQNIKDRLREAIELQSQDATERLVYTHTGWREVDGEPVYLIGSGGVGAPDIEVEMDQQLQRYQLPQPEGDPAEAIIASLDFIYIGDLEITLPLLSAMYLAPLSEIVNPAFTIWYVGPSGCFKSTITALALSHFGYFDEFTLPASWRDTQNQLEKFLFLAKDLPLVIDDWAPAQDMAKARELDVKAEHILRGQANRQGRSRMRPDTSSRLTYIPRGLLITSGEQLPGGHSPTARYFTVPIEKEGINLELLAEGKKKRHLYQMAMSHYIMWLKNQWTELKRNLPSQWAEYQTRALSKDQHARLAVAIACLYTGLTMAVNYAVEKGALEQKLGDSLLKDGWRIFTSLAAEQGTKVEKERPATKFIEGIQALLRTGTAMLRNKDDEFPKQPAPNQIAVGWEDRVNGHVLLDPLPVHQAVCQFYARTGDPFTIKKEAVWLDVNLFRTTGR